MTRRQIVTQLQRQLRAIEQTELAVAKSRARWTRVARRRKSIVRRIIAHVLAGTDPAAEWERFDAADREMAEAAAEHRAAFESIGLRSLPVRRTVQ